MMIETHNLTKTYGPASVVSSLDLRVEEGSIYGFIGPNGAGKTTTIRMLLGLVTPSEGEILLFGRDLGREKEKLLQRVGSLVETPSAYPQLTGRENLRVVATLLRLPRERIDAVLTLVDLAGDADRKVDDYSLGMKQRLGIALALIHEPQLLILDEPTNGLDLQGIREMREFLREMPGKLGITVFLSSHLLGEIELIATHIGIINAGRLIFQGTLAALQGRTKGRVSFTVSDPGKAHTLLRRHLITPQPSHDGHTLVVRAESDRAVAEMTRRLVEEEIDIYAVVPQTLHLEELFLEYTGT